MFVPVFLCESETLVHLVAMFEAEAMIVEASETVAFLKGLGVQSLAVWLALKNANPLLSSLEVSGLFKGARKAQVAELLEFLASLGQIRGVDGDRYLV
jgi:hypothetical protein